MPDKAIDLLDEACAAAALRNRLADEYAKLTKQIEGLKQSEEAEINNQPVDYEKLAVTRTELMKLEKQANEIKIRQPTFR